MKVAKYVVYNCDGQESVVLFPDCIVHNEVALASSQTGFCKPVSAGMFYLNGDKRVTIEGESRSLGIGSRPQDAILIQELLWPTKSC